MNLKNASELGDIYMSFIYRTISFYRQHLKITCKLCTPVRLEFRGLSHGTLLPLTLKTSLNANLVNIFNSTRVTCRSSLTNLWYLSLQFQISTTYFYSWRWLNIFLIVMTLERFFEYYTRRFNVLLQFQQANFVCYMLHH